MTIYEQTKDEIRSSIDGALCRAKDEGLLSFEEIPEYTIEEPREKSFGDLSANAAMVLARPLRRAPREIAQVILDHLKTEGTYIKSAEMAGAGFLNFRLDPAYIRRVLPEIEKQGDSFGRVDAGRGRRVMVEFVSANPTGPMHMGNARGGVLGDSLASVLDWAGYAVSREFYVNDAGNQIAKFGKSLEARYIQELSGEDAVEFPEDGYHGEDIRERAREYIAIHGSDLLEKSSEERQAALVGYALEKNVSALERDLARYRIHYDVWFRESTLHESGAVRDVVQELTDRGYAYQKDGAVWFAATKLGLEKDEVLIRDNGFPTYFAADIAYHKNKLADRGFDTAIDIWGADHHGHVARLKAAMTALGIDESRLEVILMQLVRLVQDGEVVRMSKRTGKAITLTDLLDEISVDAARFFFNMRQANSHFDFDLDLAVRQSNENPVFYVQYAHARIMSIIRLLGEQGITLAPTEEIDLSLLCAAQELDLMKMLAHFPEEIRLAAELREPSRITRYVQELAGAFHAFYGACRVNSGDEALTAARLRLTHATGQVIRNALTVLGLTAPEHM